MAPHPADGALGIFGGFVRPRFVLAQDAVIRAGGDKAATSEVSGLRHKLELRTRLPPAAEIEHHAGFARRLSGLAARWDKQMQFHGSLRSLLVDGLPAFDGSMGEFHRRLSARALAGQVAAPGEDRDEKREETHRGRNGWQELLLSAYIRACPGSPPPKP